MSSALSISTVVPTALVPPVNAAATPAPSPANTVTVRPLGERADLAIAGLKASHIDNLGEIVEASVEASRENRTERRAEADRREEAELRRTRAERFEAEERAAADAIALRFEAEKQAAIARDEASQAFKESDLADSARDLAELQEALITGGNVDLFA